MAKPLGDKSKVIREAIGKHPDVGNTDLAEKLNNAQDRLDDKLSFTAQDIAAQRQAMKKLGATPSPQPAPEAPPKASRNGAAVKKPERKPAPAPVPPPAPAAPAPVPDLAGHVEAIRAAVKNLGADQVKKLVGLFE